MLQPTPQLLSFLDWEIGAFFHFGIRSFFPGHEDWDGKPMPASTFNPAELNCGQWLSAAKAMGATYAIMTCKHHDGFALWPSRYTAYSVAASPFGGDVVQAFTTACRQAGMKVGLYYSPAQWGDEYAHQTDREYDDYFIGQLSELLTGYGKIDYLWLDGCGSEGKHYDHRRITAEIRRLQPGILIFGDVLLEGADIRWIGNEEGVASLDNGCIATQIAFSVNDAGRTAEPRFMPAECDMRLRFSSWFDCKENECDLASAPELLGNYELSVGRSANLLVNAGPNSRGLLHEKDVQRMQEFGQLWRSIYAHPLPYGPLKQEGGLFVIEHAAFAAGSERAHEVPLVNRVVLQEDLTQGQRVKRFQLWARLRVCQQNRVLLYQGCTIGHKHIAVLPTIAASRLELEILDSDGEAAITSMTAHYSNQ